MNQKQCLNQSKIDTKTIDTKKRINFFLAFRFVFFFSKKHQKKKKKYFNTKKYLWRQWNHQLPNINAPFCS